MNTSRVKNPKSAGLNQIKNTTIDLNQAAASYDLFTGTTKDCILKSLVVKLPDVDVSDDATITSISFHTDDTTNHVLINTTDGAKANLTAEKQLSWTGCILIKTGTKIQCTIAGGAADAETVCDVVAEYISIETNGYLA